MRWTIAAALAAVLCAGSADARDRDNNPPGPRGGPGTNWENPPGPAGGWGASADRRWGYRGGHYWYWWDGRWHRWNAALRCWATDFDGNPPGVAGGVGTNWENPPGPAGGPGASPDRFGRCR